jgi:tRNA-specific 2-thiouridylase
VVRIDAGSGKVSIGPRSQLGRSEAQVADVRWLRPIEAQPFRCEVQFRHHSAAHPATVVSAPDGCRATVQFDRPAEGVSPGQAAVFFRDDEVLGGGWIGG